MMRFFQRSFGQGGHIGCALCQLAFDPVDHLCELLLHKLSSFDLQEAHSTEIFSTPWPPSFLVLPHVFYLLSPLLLSSSLLAANVIYVLMTQLGPLYSTLVYCL